MQRVTNCMLVDEQHVLTLQKPSRGWWVVPGGKMEPGESVKESVVREFYEETGYTISSPQLRGVFTVVIEEDGEVIDEWMLFTFVASSYEGEMLSESPEGKLAWTSNDDVLDLPMAAGDYHILQHMLTKEGPLYGSFRYSSDYELLSYRLDPPSTLSSNEYYDA
ncbi:8-oxo-dGTP diphosphatase [Texcoconibacillus texcoconensis]|uniref:8-oxo-dGTP diphosphatase n=1 Tax=Texcoconibacillus texcoconensis TaxID=1095777 RepID=A0A840QQ08_9BACI|nr:8-oxo-dGTP diphosphatase [Texcoconibacillus texcoconensis]MBB5173450.1 8-oxo-dGTP diphosphatase [Texcoconibacillus texcoconensis]